MRPVVLGDEEVRRLPRAAAVAAVRTIIEQSSGLSAGAPARQRVELGDGAIVFTSGKLTQPRVRGFRAYETHNDRDQIVVIWDADGQVDTVVHGVELGPMRTGAIGAVAVDYLAPLGIGTLAILGTGPQAMEQLACIMTVRAPGRIVVWSPQEKSRRFFAERAAELHGCTVATASSADAAVCEADVLVSATGATRPFLTGEQLRTVVHINAIGPKVLGSHELPLDSFENAELLVTDSLAQANASGDLVVSSRRLSPLSSRLGRGNELTERLSRSIFLSLGLAGTELAVACAVRDHCK